MVYQRLLAISIPSWYESGFIRDLRKPGIISKQVDANVLLHLDVNEVKEGASVM